MYQSFDWFFNAPVLGLFLWGFKMPEFKVLREHDGDKFYFPGDVRTANAADVAHLVKNGVLVLVDDGAEAAKAAELAKAAEAAELAKAGASETKLAPAHENKADKPAKVK